MTCKSLYGGFLLAVLGAISRADDKSGLRADSPPRIVSVVGVKGDVVSYRDFLSMPVIPKASGRPRPGELTPALPSSGPMIACAVEFSLGEGKVFDVDGQQLGAEAAKKRLVPGGHRLGLYIGEKGRSRLPANHREGRSHPRPSAGPARPAAAGG
jgi:hypothetical protein